jgi:hypothetical protein
MLDPETAYATLKERIEHLDPNVPDSELFIENLASLIMLQPSLTMDERIDLHTRMLFRISRFVMHGLPLGLPSEP